MGCYITKTKEPSREEFKLWQSFGYTGTYEDFCSSKCHVGISKVFVCGDLGEHCSDCAGFGDYLCDYPVGEGKTCDRHMCDDHANEIAPNLHYCDAHYAMWKEFVANGGVNENLRNVIAFKVKG